VNDVGIKEDMQQWKKSNPIKLFRVEKGLSQSDLASLLGVATYTIQRWEEGSTKPSGDNGEKLEKVIVGFNDQWEQWQKGKPSL
jgi:DNA-binding transcriptional regulator YiaG